MAEKETLDPNDDSQYNTMDLDSISETMDTNQLEDDQNFMDQFVENKPEVIQEEEKPKDENVQEEEQDDAQEEEQDDEDKEELTLDELSDDVSQSEKAELEELNSKFGTDFKDIKSFKDSLHREKNDEQAEQIDRKRNLLGYYKDVMKRDSRSILIEDEKAKAAQEGKDVKDEAVLDLINEKLDTLEDNGTLDYAARTILSELANLTDKLESDIDTFDQSKKQTEEDRITDKKEAVEKAVLEMYNQKDYYGLQLEKKAYLDAYRKVTKGELVKIIENDPRIAVELQLFLDNRKNLSSLNNSASYNDGIRDTFDAIKGKSTKSIEAVRNDKKSTPGLSSFIADFLK